MANIKKVVDGNLEITKTGDAVITTLSPEEVVGKRAEAQTKVDHLKIDLTEAQAEVDQWDVDIASMSK